MFSPGVLGVAVVSPFEIGGTLLLKGLYRFRDTRDRAKFFRLLFSTARGTFYYCVSGAIGLV